jgi:3-hydroxyisobutyrate dehydrogenase-like beta-hydroxyacid dehydrogenase
MRIAFIGFGGAGYGLAKGLKASGLDTVYFFDTLWNTPPYDDVIMKNAAETGAVLVKNLEELLKTADIVISCVTGKVAVSVAEEAAAFLERRHLYVDVNTASPKVMERVASAMEKTGAVFVDAAMMGPIPSFLHRVPILASGPGAISFRERMQPYEMNITCIGEKAGQASAIKMFRSIFMKGFLALLLEMLNATHRYNVDDMVLNSIAESMEKNSFLETVRLQVSKGVVNAERMAHEMEDVIQTMNDMGVPAIMAPAAMEKLNRCADMGLKEYFGNEMPESLNEILDVLERKIAAEPDAA